MTSTNLIAMLACLALLGPQSAHARTGQVPPQTPDGTPEETEDIEVVGARPERPTAVPPVGSRVAGAPVAGFGTVASSNVAGLDPGSGMDPFAGGSKMISEVSCRSDNPRLSAGAACRLLPIQRLIAAGDLEGARAAIDRFASDPLATDEERYVAGALQYRVAVLAGEADDREDALKAMLATEAMPAMSRPPALRTLVAMALRRGDRIAAGAHLVDLLALVPDDTRSLVNLAGIRAEAGDGSGARTLVDRAIEIARSRGEPIPAEWSSFASASR